MMSYTQHIEVSATPTTVAWQFFTDTVIVKSATWNFLVHINSLSYALEMYAINRRLKGPERSIFLFCFFLLYEFDLDFGSIPSIISGLCTFFLFFERLTIFYLNIYSRKIYYRPHFRSKVVLSTSFLFVLQPMGEMLFVSICVWVYVCMLYMCIYLHLWEKKNNLHRSDRPHGGAQHSDPLVRPGLFFFLSAYIAKRLFVMFTYMHEDFNDRFIQQ